MIIYCSALAVLLLLNLGMNMESDKNVGMNILGLLVFLPLFGRVFGWW